MSFRRDPLLRMSIGDMFLAMLEFDGATYSLRTETALSITNVLICGMITDRAESLTQENRPIYKSLVDDGTGCIWIHTAEERLSKKAELWQEVDVIGTIEFNPSRDGKAVEIFVRPSAVLPISDPYHMILHTLDATHQKTVLSESGRFESSKVSQSSKSPTIPNTVDSSSQISSTKFQDASELEEGMEDASVTNQDGETSIEDQIVAVLRQKDSGDGVSLETIRQMLERVRSLGEDEIEDVLFNMQMDGTIYEPTWRVYKLSE